MKVIYDAQQDTVRILFRNAPIARSAAEQGGMIVDYAHDGSLVGLEMTNASQRIHNPRTVEFSPVIQNAAVE